MNKEDVNKIHELIKSDDKHNKLLGFMLGRSGGLSDLELFKLINDNGFNLNNIVEVNITLGNFQYCHLLGLKEVCIFDLNLEDPYHYNTTHCCKNLNNENILTVFTQFLNLVL